MSLEEALNRNSDLMVEHNKLLTQVLGMSASKKSAPAAEEAAPAEDAPKPKRTRASKKADAEAEEEKGDDEVSFNDLKTELAAWLGEFKADENDPETEARKKVLGATMKKLGAEKLGEIADDQEKLGKLQGWLQKAKAVDKGHGDGRFTAKPSDEDAEDEDDDLDV